MPASNSLPDPVTDSSPARTRSEKSSPSIFWLLAAIALPIMNLAVKYEIRDGKKLPRSGAFVFAPNHYSEIDPVVMGVVAWKLGRLPHFMAKGSLFRIPVLGYLLRKSGQIPVERGGSVRGSEPVKAAERMVEKGQMVVVYPEGTLTRDPDLWPMRGKTGAVRTALEQGIPVIPAAHWGTQLVMPRYAKKISLFPRKTIDVRFGPAVDLSAFAGRKLDTAALAEATDIVMDAITAIFEELRGEKAPAERWDPSKHNQKDTGRFEQ